MDRILPSRQAIGRMLAGLAVRSLFFQTGLTGLTGFSLAAFGWTGLDEQPRSLREPLTSRRVRQEVVFVVRNAATNTTPGNRGTAFTKKE
jgi:hypothetical protein